MSLYGYTFIKEIKKFNLDDYLPYMGWISSDPTLVKIYWRDDSDNYFLHDENLDKLYEFSYDSKTHMKESYEFQNAITAYYLQFPRNADR